jgi:hypothetical protein
MSFDRQERKYLFDVYGRTNADQDYLISRKYTHITRPSTALPSPFIERTHQKINSTPNQQGEDASVLTESKQRDASIIPEKGARRRDIFSNRSLLKKGKKQQQLQQ